MLTKAEQELIKKYEQKKKANKKKSLKDLYLAQTDKNYKDGDRN